MVKRICGSLSYLRYERFIVKCGAELGSKSHKDAGSKTLCQTSLISAGKYERQKVQAERFTLSWLVHGTKHQQTATIKYPSELQI